MAGDRVRELWVHVGGYKTGSTAFQVTVGALADTWEEAGVHVVRTGLAGGRHHALFWSRSNQDLWHKLREELADTAASTALISSEHFSWSARSILEELGIDSPFVLRPVFVSRRPDHVLLSHYADRVGMGETSSFAAYAWERCRKPDIDAVQLSRVWNQAKSGVVVPYHPARATERLIGVLGVESAGILDAQAHVSLKADVVGAVRASVREGLKLDPRLDTAAGRLALAASAARACQARADSPTMSSLGLPRDLLLNVLDAAASPALLCARFGWSESHDDGWDPEDIVADAFPGTADEWEQALEAHAHDLRRELPVVSLVTEAHERVEQQPAAITGLGAQAVQERVRRQVQRLRPGSRHQADERPSRERLGRRIPRRLFQYWDQSLPPQEISALLGSWRTVNPLHEYRLLSRESFLESLEGEDWQDRIAEAFERCGHPAFESDIVRLMELFRHGGVYADADHEALAPVERLWSADNGLVLVQRPNGIVATSLMAAEPGHPFLALLVERVVAAAPQIRPGAQLWHVTGPGMVTRCARMFAFAPSDLIVPWNETTRCQRVHNDLAYKADHWSGVHPLQLRGDLDGNDE